MMTFFDDDVIPTQRNQAAIDTTNATKPNPYAPPVQSGRQTEARVIRDQAPPPPQAVYRSTQFATYESDSFANSYDWARKDLMIGYPGTRATLERLHSLILQHQNGSRRDQEPGG